MSNNSSLRFYFRVIVLLAVALNVGWGFLPYIEYNFYGPEKTDLLRWAGYGSPLGWDALVYIWYTILVAYGITCIGLIYFKSWSRECFILVKAIVLLLTFVYGVSVTSEFSSFYGQIMILLEGFIIAMVYFSELRSEFTVTHNKRMQSDAAEPRR